MDDIARFNKERWEELVRAGVSFSRPWHDIDVETALARVDKEGVMGHPGG